MTVLRRNLLLLLGVLSLLGATACGDDGGGDPETQPAPDVTTFEEGDFSGIPLPPLAEQAGERSEEDGVVSQSYFVRNRTPEEILDFYAEYFDTEGVPVVMSPEPVGTEAWRGRWLHGDRELLISATPAPTAAGDGTETTTQMSLELWPSGESEHEDDTTTSSVDDG